MESETLKVAVRFGLEEGDRLSKETVAEAFFLREFGGGGLKYTIRVTSEQCRIAAMEEAAWETTLQQK
ncbi:hypothetical protein HPP92_011625 [Vanilla planifolia]|uniref:Uncharacterized protein n=1 Tax=Vanilla planifolia TaxID=51239 RepID=A0A835R6D8_VANPL|nr:hypothetical protein HPP92_011625 [Vanilla planifolia]